MAITWGSGGVFGSIGKAIKEANANSTNATEMLIQSINWVQSYIQYNFKYVAEAVETSLSDLYAILKSRMDDDSQTVDGNSVTAGAISFTGEGTGSIQDNGVPTLGQVTPSQMLLNDDVIELEYVSAGSDQWTVRTMRRGLLSNRATTGTLYEGDTDQAGIEFTINAPASAVANDGGGLIGNPTAIPITGGVRSSNCDANGKVYIDISGGPTYTIRAHKSSADRTADTNRVFDGTYTAIGDLTITEQNSSGLAGSINIAALGTDADIEITLLIPYVASDKYEMAAAVVTDDGVIQSWFRDNLDIVLPYDIGGSETIPDTLAE